MTAAVQDCTALSHHVTLAQWDKNPAIVRSDGKSNVSVSAKTQGKWESSPAPNPPVNPPEAFVATPQRVNMPEEADMLLRNPQQET